MLFFKQKNIANEFKELSNYKIKIDKLLLADKYISKKEYLSLYSEIKPTYDKLLLMAKEAVIKS